MGSGAVCDISLHLDCYLQLGQFFSWGFNGNNVSYALSETPNGCQARMPLMLLADVR